MTIVQETLSVPKTYMSYKQGISYTYNYIKQNIINTNADKELKKRWLILNNKYKNAFLSNDRIHLFKTCTGSGKTFTSVMWVEVLTKIASEIEGFVVLSAEYEHGTDEIERIIIKHGEKTDYIRFEGKNRLCKKLEKKINSNGDTLQDLISNGISINTFCEEECDYKEECIYKNNCRKLLSSLDKGGIRNWIGVSHQIGRFLPIFLQNSKNIILVIDEDFTDSIKVSNRYTVPILRKNYEFLELALKDLYSRMEINKKKNKIDLFYELISCLRDFIKLLLESLYDFKKELDYDKIQDILEDIDLLKGIDNYYIEKLNNLAYIYVKSKKIKPFKFIFGEMANFIDNYENEEPLKNFKEIKKWIRSAFYKKKNKFEITFLYYDKCMLERVFKMDNVDKVIINDATANKIILSHVIKDRENIVEHNEDWMYGNVEFYQLRKNVNNRNDRDYAHYPKSSFLHESTFNFLMDDLKLILKKHNDSEILVVARDIKGKKLPFNGGISLSDYISTLGYINVIYEDYPLQGTNIYSDVDVIVILGKPDLPNTVISRQSQLLGLEKKEYRKIYSTTHIKQAIGRIFRGSNQKYVYLLTGFNVDIEKQNREIRYFKSHTSLRNTLKTQIKLKEEKEILKKRVKELIKYFEKEKFISISKFEKIMSISYYKASKFLKKLHNRGYLKMVKGKRGKLLFYRSDS